VKALLHSELIKLRTTRTFWALAGVSIAIAIVFVSLSAILTDDLTKDSVIQDVFLSDPTGLFILILGIVGITGEWRHRTITSSLLAAPLRVRFLFAKLLAFAAAGALLSLVISVVIGVVGTVILEVRDQPTPDVADLVEQFARNIGVAALFGALGVCIGGLIRNQPTAIVFVLIMLFVVDFTLGDLAPSVERYSPTGAVPSAIQGFEPDDVGTPEVDFLGAWPALALELAWIGALFAGAAALLRRRDVD
jgi:ABC-type transport system involved in multi-copper enzyme maturation permease subunit